MIGLEHHHRDRPIPADAFAFVSDVAKEVQWRTGVTEAGFTAESPLRVGPEGLRVGPEGYDLAGETPATWRVVALGDSTAVD